MTQLSALIFDVDGTLAETEHDAHLPAFNQTFAAHGLDWHWSSELYGQLLKISGGKERMHYYLEHYRPDYQAPPHLEQFIAQLHVEKTVLYNRMVAAGQVSLCPGVKRLILEARAAGVRLAIATTTSLDNVYTLLESNLAQGSSEWFEVIGAGNMVPRKKPDPGVYQYVLDALRLPAQECFAFEDSNNGIRAASGAGLPCLITPSQYTHGEDFSGARLVVDTLGEPGQPCHVLAGDAGGAEYVDLALLRRLL